MLWLHAPAPEQNEAGWTIDPLHDAARPHDTLAAAFWQPPAPSQAPVLPHGGAAAHCPDGAAPPAGTAVHVPALPVRLQAAHIPHDAALQQTPSAQNSLLHSRAAPQVEPSAFFATQVPAVPLPVQYSVLFAQCASDVQSARQVLLVLQT